MSKYLYATNTLTNNEIDMPALQTSMGIQRQVGILHELPAMSLQRESGEIMSRYSKLSEEQQQKSRESARNWYVTNHADPKFRKHRKRYLKQWRKDNPDYMYQYHLDHKDKEKERRDGPRKQLIMLLGGKCCCDGKNCWHKGKCVCDDIRALHNDHINGGGTKEIKQHNYNTWKLYKTYLANPKLAKKTLQVLCASCNWVKRYNNKEYSGGIKRKHS